MRDRTMPLFFWPFILLAEIACLLFAVFIFNLLSRPEIAGLLAGCLFLFLGLTLLMFGFWFKNFRRTLAFFAASAYLLLATLPILFVRLWFWGESFKAVQIGSVYIGPLLHKFAEIIYLALLGATIWGWREAVVESKKKS